MTQRQKKKPALALAPVEWMCKYIGISIIGASVHRSSISHPDNSCAAIYMYIITRGMMNQEEIIEAAAKHRLLLHYYYSSLTTTSF
jgi:hypothetical protein